MQDEPMLEHRTAEASQIQYCCRAWLVLDCRLLKVDLPDVVLLSVGRVCGPTPASLHGSNSIRHNQNFHPVPRHLHHQSLKEDVNESPMIPSLSMSPTLLDLMNHPIVYKDAIRPAVSMGNKIRDSYRARDSILFQDFVLAFRLEVFPSRNAWP